MLLRRFTLVELMIVVAIVAVLAAVAVPIFAEMQAKARFSEAAPNAETIARVALVKASTTPFSVVTVLPNPRLPTEVDKSLVAWGAPGGGWSELDWAPDGAVRCAYDWSFVTPAQALLEVHASCDVDGNGVGAAGVFTRGSTFNTTLKCGTTSCGDFYHPTCTCY